MSWDNMLSFLYDNITDHQAISLLIQQQKDSFAFLYMIDSASSQMLQQNSLELGEGWGEGWWNTAKPTDHEITSPVLLVSDLPDQNFCQ